MQTFALATSFPQSARDIAQWINELPGDRLGPIDTWQSLYTIERVVSVSIVPAGKGLADAVVLIEVEYDELAEVDLGAAEEALLDRVYGPVEQRGDPNCEQCHGTGCAQCNDEIYYAEEDFMEQYRRDRAIDQSGQDGYRVS